MKQRILIIPPTSNVVPLVIPISRFQFVHATLVTNNKHPYKSPNLEKIIHHRKTKPTMLPESIACDKMIINHRKPRILCLHGFRTSGEIFKTQLKKWPESVLEKIDFFFPDGPFPCNGKSEVEGIFDPPYYEWFQFNKEFTEYENFDKCLEYIEECMIKHAPIDGFLGFSQGAILSAALPGLQAEGIALTRVPKIKFIMIVSGAKLKNESLAEKAYSLPIQCPSLHFLGDADFLKPYGTELLKSVQDPIVISHPKGHTIPRLDEQGLEKMLKFVERIQKIVSNKEDVV